MKGIIKYLARYCLSITLAFVNIPFSPFVEADTSAGESSDNVHRHMVLADCSQGSGKLSEVAYYDSIGGTPLETAIVATPNGQNYVWENSETRVRFADAGFNFTASLGPEGKDGDYAGTAHSDYANFTCWQQPPSYVYNSYNLACTQRYYCGHATLSSSSGTSSPSSSATANTTSPPPSSSKPLSIGEIFGLSVTAVYFVVLAGVAVFARRCWICKRKKNSPQTLEGEPAKGQVAELDGFPTGDDSGKFIPVYELDGQQRPIEIHSIPLGELQGNSRIRSTVMDEMYEYGNWI